MASNNHRKVLSVSTAAQLGMPVHRPSVLLSSQAVTCKAPAQEQMGANSRPPASGWRNQWLMGPPAKGVIDVSMMCALVAVCAHQ